MADTKISALPAVTTLDASDEFPLAHSGTTKKITALSLTAALGATSGGWASAGETWTYSGADDPTYTFDITGDFTATYSPGMRLRVSQSTGGTKYFIVTKVAESGGTTTVTVYGGTDYDLNNETISSPSYSFAKAPVLFPLNPAKWTVETTDTSDRAQASPVNGTWYNPGSLTISVPIGCWRLMYEALGNITNTASDTAITAYFTLSTANNSQSDISMTSVLLTADANAAGKQIIGMLHRERFLTLTSKTSYFLNAMVDSGGSSLNIRGDLGTTVIRAVCAYL